MRKWKQQSLLKIKILPFRKSCSRLELFGTSFLLFISGRRKFLVRENNNYAKLYIYSLPLQKKKQNSWRHKTCVFKTQAPNFIFKYTFMLSFLAWLSTQTVVVITANYLLYLFLKETLQKTEVLFYFFFQKTIFICF